MTLPGGDALYGHTLTLLVRFFRKVRCVVLATGVRVNTRYNYVCMNVDRVKGVSKDEFM